MIEMGAEMADASFSTSGPARPRKVDEPCPHRRGARGKDPRSVEIVTGSLVL